MHSANSSQRFPSLAPATLCEMPGALHAQGIYFTHKEGLLGREEWGPAAPQHCSSSRILRTCCTKGKKRRDGRIRLFYALQRGCVFVWCMHTCVPVCRHSCGCSAQPCKLSFPHGLNTRISSASWKTTRQFMCQGKSKKTCRKEKVCRSGWKL